MMTQPMMIEIHRRNKIERMKTKTGNERVEKRVFRRALPVHPSASARKCEGLAVLEDPVDGRILEQSIEFERLGVVELFT